MRTITEQERERFRAMGRKGGATRAKQFSSAFQRAARAHVSRESCVANGRKGGIAYVQKYGKRKLVEQARQYRLNHPSDLEQIVTDALAQVGATEYEREGYVFPDSSTHHNTGDFLFRASQQIVYADGAAWHNGKDLPASLAECSDRAMRDAKMDNYLRGQGWRVLRLSEAVIYAHQHGDAGAMLTQLRMFLALA